MKTLFSILKSWTIKFIIALLKFFQHSRAAHLDRARFLVPAYTGLGNFIMMTPMLNAVRKLYPSCQIYVLGGNDFGTEFVLDGTDVVNKTWVLKEKSNLLKKLWFFWKLRTKNIDVAFIPFDASPSFYWFGVVVAGIPRRIGHTSDVLRVPMGWTRDVLTDAVSIRSGRHETDLHLDLLEVLKPGVPRSYATTVSAGDDREVMKKFDLVEGSYIVLQVSAANGNPSAKVWPTGNFQLLAQRLSHEGFTVVLAGDCLEKPIVDRFAEACSVPVVNLAGRTTVPEVASVIRRAAALVCHDSALMHIGNALGTPLIALYGPTDYVYTRPKGERSVMIRKDLPCAPCMANFAKTEEEAYRDCPIEFECMKRISVDEVFDAVLKQARTAHRVAVEN
jgi:heptosyltransferase-2